MMAFGFLFKPRWRRILCAALFLAGLGSARAGDWTVFDESRAFDEDYAQRWLYVSQLTEMYTAAVFAGDNLPVSDGGDRDWPDSDNLPRFNGEVYAVDPLCGCKVNLHGQIIDPTHCPAMVGVGEESRAHLTVQFILDRDALAGPLKCFRQGSRMCRDEGGVSYGGVTCCQRVDRGYEGAVHDPEFYILVPQPVADALIGLKLGQARAGSPQVCGISIDKDQGVFSMPREFDGLIARAWLHAMKHYGTEPPTSSDILAKISASSPALLFELDRERTIRLRYGVGNDLYDSALRAVPATRAFGMLGYH